MVENRKTVRKPFDRFVFYFSSNGFREGTLIEYSQGGLSIRDKVLPKVDEIITVALPYKEETVKKKATVIWVGEDSFGVEFFQLKKVWG